MKTPPPWAGAKCSPTAVLIAVIAAWKVKDVLLDQRRHDAGQNVPGDLADAAGGKGGSERNASISSSAQPVLRIVEDQDDAPLLRKGSRATTGGGLLLPSLPAPTMTPPSAKRGCRCRSGRLAPTGRRVALCIERQVVKCAQRCCDGERDLRAGAEAGMVRDRLPR